MKRKAASRRQGLVRRSKVRSTPVRILTAVPICDGHDSAIMTINFELVRHGVEVIYLGYHRPAREIVRAAIQEDVQAIGLSSYNGGHNEFISEVLRLLRTAGASNIGVFAGGGGTITPADATLLKRRGVDEIFFAGAPLDSITTFVINEYGDSRRRARHATVTNHSFDRNLSVRLSQSASGRGLTRSKKTSRRSAPRSSTRVVGVTGPGGAGKTTLIDEMALRFLQSRPEGRLGILSHDPSFTGKGALLGDRAGMVYAQHERVFIRSLGTRGQPGGLASNTRQCLAVLKRAGFDLVLVETAGIGQEALPFDGLVDKQVLVMSPEYGGRIQLQKIVMLEAADIVVVNKADIPAAATALGELGQRLRMNQRGQTMIGTIAKRHRDPGVDQLFLEVMA
jgi:methylmalonyl-CoA mutase cobalamin-binding domain/chain